MPDLISVSQKGVFVHKACQVFCVSALHLVNQITQKCNDFVVRNLGASGAGIEVFAGWIDAAFEEFFWH